jgi:integrase
MRPKKARKPFTLYQRETQKGTVWYVRFWDETVQRYAVTRSTGVLVGGKKKRRYEAEQAAREMLPRIEFAPATVEKSFIQYVKDFWSPDSLYVREAALVKKRPLSAYYISMNHKDTDRHIASFPPFKDISLQKLTPALIRDWLIWMAEKGLSGDRIENVLQGMRVAVRCAVAREELEKDPFRHIGKVAKTSKEKGVLTPDEVTKLIAAPITDPRHRLAVLLGVLCGMRMGEVRGLQWSNIKDGLIKICNNWINGEGMKAPKCKGGSARENPRAVPLPSSIVSILEILRSLNPAPDSFILGSFEKPGEPVSKEFFRYVIDKELAAIGIPGKWKGKGHAPEGYVNEQKMRNLTFHSTRHTFITLGRLAGISDLEIQALAGHKSGAMMENYSHAAQVLDFVAAREKLEKAVGI